MKNSIVRMVLVLVTFLTGVAGAFGEGLTPEQQAKVDSKVKEITTWASDPVLVKAVREHNQALPADVASMNQEKWQALTVLDPIVRGFTKNEAGGFLKSKKDAVIAEAFVSGTDGTKVAFLSKTTNWCHKGKPKHEEPMAGKTWQGKVELDESSGLQQVQVSVPVLDGGKPIGSLVVGLSVSKLDSK